MQEGVGIEGLAGVTRALTPTLILPLTLPLTLTLTLSLSLTWLDEWLTRGLALQGDHEARRGDIQRTGGCGGGARRGGCVRVGVGFAVDLAPSHLLEVACRQDLLPSCLVGLGLEG